MRSADRVHKCLLFEVDRTYRGHHETDAFDPKETSPEHIPGVTLIIHCNTRGTGGTWPPSVLVPVMTTTEAVVPARSLMLAGAFSMRTITGMRCASRIHSKVGLTEGNSSKPVLPFCWAMPQPMLSTLPSKGVLG